MKKDDLKVNKGPSTSHKMEEELWKILWKLNVPSKIKKASFGELVVIPSQLDCYYGKGK